MHKILFISDLHLGLHTDNIDRTPEIIRVVKKDLYNRAAKLIKAKYKVDIVFGGDIFNKNTPSESNIAAFIQIINMFSSLDCHLYVMAGNHDTISDPKRLSCLSFIKKLSEVYDYVTLVDDIKAVKYHVTDAGQYYLIFLPHINNAHLEKSRVKYKSTQDYINSRVSKIYKKLGNGVQTIVFSHLDIKGAVAGDEANLLMKSTVQIPNSIIDNTEDKILPTIISGHIHLSQCIKNIHIVGSPIYTDFSDCNLMDKFVGEITLPNEMRESTKVVEHETSCTPFIQVDIDVHDSKDDVTQQILDKINSELKKPKSDAFLKIDLTVSSESIGYLKLGEIEQYIKTKFGYKVKKVVPKIIRTKTRRNKALKIGLPPAKALRIFMKNDRYLKRPDVKPILAMADKYFEIGLNQ